MLHDPSCQRYYHSQPNYLCTCPVGQVDDGYTSGSGPDPWPPGRYDDNAFARWMLRRVPRSVFGQIVISFTMTAVAMVALISIASLVLPYVSMFWHAVIQR